jgi:hypothetical protein
MLRYINGLQNVQQLELHDASSIVHIPSAAELKSSSTTMAATSSTTKAVVPLRLPAGKQASQASKANKPSQQGAIQSTNKSGKQAGKQAAT